MGSFFLSGEIGSFEGGLGLGRSSCGYWYGDGRILDIPTIGAVKLPKDLVKPTFYPVFPGIFSHCSEESYHCGFLWALKAYQEGNLFSALVFFQEGSDSPEVAAMMGFIMLLQGKVRGAIPFLEMSLVEDEGDMGSFLRELGLVPYITFVYDPGVKIGFTVSLRGLMAIWARCYGRMGFLAPARDVMERLAMGVADSLLLLELVELYFSEGEYNRVVELLHDLENETPVHTALLFYLAMALEALDIPKLALVSYNKALRRKRGRDPRLLRRIRYRRALLYDKMGMRRRYRQELGRLWEEDPHFQDLGDRMAELL